MATRREQDPYYGYDSYAVQEGDVPMRIFETEVVKGRATITLSTEYGEALASRTTDVKRLRRGSTK